jgi:Type I phosphodiesterase / nucleotide pyrophosphatase
MMAADCERGGAQKDMLKTHTIHSFRTLATALAALASLVAPVGAAPGKATAGDVRLVVVIVVDQFRYDYLERFHDLFGKDGFRRLTDNGASFTDANFDYVPTYTGPGHAAVFTGSVPAHNGIVGNSWFDRATGQVHPIVFDPDVRMVTGDGPQGKKGAPSPRLLIGTTLGDQMRMSNHFRSRVVSISQKDRAAVLPGGKRPNGAYWFDAARGEFVTSDYYLPQLPAWVKRFNRDQGPDRFFGKRWERSRPQSAYARAQSKREEPVASSPEDVGLGDALTGGLKKPGPTFYAAFEMTPFASDLLADFAETAVTAESLGVDTDPDLLAVSFSAPDFVGHTYGPDSQEVEDTYLRLDATLAGLLDFIDAHVGLAHTIVAITGDHGVCPVPAYLRAHGIDAGSVSMPDVTSAVETALSSRFGSGTWVRELTNDQIFLDDALIQKRKLDAQDVQRVAGEAALTVHGMASYFTRAQIMGGDLPAGPIAERVGNGFDPERCGDVCLVMKPFYFAGESAAATHGSGYPYDTHVPVVLFGPGVRPGRYNDACTPSDITPTLAAMLGVQPPPTRTGRVLTEALSTTPRR